MWPIFGTLMLLSSVGASWTDHYDMFLSYADDVADSVEYEATEMSVLFEHPTPSIRQPTTDSRIDSLERTTLRMWHAIEGLQGTLCLLVMFATALLFVQCVRPAPNRTPSTRTIAVVEPLTTTTKTVSPV